MKFDCYQRFLKSSMFKECMIREMQGQPLLYQGQAQAEDSASNDKQKLSGELKKRKSLIPWHKCILSFYLKPYFYFEFFFFL